VHTFRHLIPIDALYQEHPEYFALIDGTRAHDNRLTQPCLTNPDLLEIGKQRLRQWIEDRPEASIISVSQNDSQDYCRCERCTALAKREGSQSGPILAFVNSLAADIRDDYPDKLLSTLAYQYSRRPPSALKPGENVLIRLCTIEGCSAHPIADSDCNRSLREDINGWSRITDRLFIWDYTVGFVKSMAPFPNLHVLQPNIKYFADHGAAGVYAHGCFFTRGSELAELRSYIIAKTLWDPEYDTDTAIDEFLAAYYGQAAPHIRSYIDLIHNALTDSGQHMGIFVKGPREMEFLTQQLISEASMLFDRAEQAVWTEPVTLHRVQVARLPVLFSRISLALGPQAASQPETPGTKQLAAWIDRFERIARKEGVTQGGAGHSLDTWLALVRGVVARGAAPGQRDSQQP
jgi:hypothetical protein